MQIAAQLHDCGKYISMGDVAECSYRIIMATEIIGLSTEERKIIANAVRYNTTDFVSYELLKDEETGLGQKPVPADRKADSDLKACQCYGQKPLPEGKRDQGGIKRKESCSW